MASREGSFTEQLPASGGDGTKTRFTTDTDVLDVLDFPCLEDQDTVEFLRSHGRVVFFVRGLAGSSKWSVSSRLQELYPGSCVCWSNEGFTGPDAEPKTKDAIQKAHAICRQKAAEYMKHNAPAIIIRNPNVRVWEMSAYLQQAATYGYTVIILDLSKYLTFNSQVLAATNTHCLDEEYMERRLKQWEDVHPFAMGWSPRIGDAASLLRRYEEIAACLTKDNNHVQLKHVRNSGVYPFCPARVCWFGWDEENSNYSCSEAVTSAYGSKDMISVFGYTVLGDLVLAVVHLTDVQAALTGDGKQAADRNAAQNGAKDEGDSKPPMVCEFDEMRCTLCLDAFSAQALGDEASEQMSDYCELPPPSRVSFIVLGSTSSEPITYSEAVRRCAPALRDALLHWKDTPASLVRTDVGAFAVYGASSENSYPILVLDKTVKLDVVFTGYYQSHTTRKSVRCVTWSTGVACVRRPLLDTPQHAGAGCDKQTTLAGDVWCPADNAQLLDGIDLPCIQEEKTRRFLRTHGRLLFLVRGRASCRKSAAVAELEELYPVSRAYLSEMPPDWNSATVRQLHVRCLDTTEGFMKTGSAVIVNQNQNLTVWDVSGFLALASSYGYTVIIVDFWQQIDTNPKVSSAANNKPYVFCAAKQWEDVHPFAMGWSTRPKDAAFLLQRFRQLRETLRMKDLTLTTRDVSCSQVFPFCLAKLCRFGRTREDRDYCKSDKVRKAYGRTDTLRVFGYAISRGYVFALLELSDEQASLTRGDGDASDDLDPQSWKEVSCTVDLEMFSPEDDGSDQEGFLLRGSHRISFKDLEPSRVTIMPLGSLEGTKYSYSVAAGVPWALLSTKLRSWTAQLRAGAVCAKSVDGIDVYGYTKPTDGVLLLVDSATVELDVVFTGYYHPHTTALSRRSQSWSRGARFNETELCTRRQGRKGDPHEAAHSWRSPQRGRSKEDSQKHLQWRQLLSGNQK